MKKFLTALLVLILCRGAAIAAPLSVTTGAGYMKMVKELALAYRGGGKEITEVYGGNLGQMLAQISAGNGVNVVISDRGTLKSIKTDVKFSQTQPLGTTALVLAWRKGVEISSPNDLVSDGVKSVAYPDPKAAIYGRAASKYLENTGLGKKIAPKVSQLSTVPQVFSYLVSGEMDAGFVNRVVVRAGGDKIGGSLEIPSGYPPIVMIAAVVAGEEKNEAVADFIGFLGSAKAKAIMDKHGVR